MVPDQLVRYIKGGAFEVIRLPNTDVPVAGGSMEDLDMRRAQKIHKSLHQERPCTTTHSIKKELSLRQIEKAIEEEQAALKGDRKELIIGEDDADDAKPKSVADAPMRPCKTASTKQVLTEADFPLAGRYLADDVSIHRGYRHFIVSQWLTDSRTDRGGKGNRLNERVSIPCLYCKAQTSELIGTLIFGQVDRSLAFADPQAWSNSQRRRARRVCRALSRARTILDGPTPS